VLGGRLKLRLGRIVRVVHGQTSLTMPPSRRTSKFNEWVGTHKIGVSLDINTTACHAGLDPASSSVFEYLILASASMTKGGEPTSLFWGTGIGATHIVRQFGRRSKLKNRFDLAINRHIFTTYGCC